MCAFVYRSKYCRMSLPGLSPTAALPFDVNNTIGALLIGGLLATAYVSDSAPLEVSNWCRKQAMGNYMCTGDDADLVEYCPTYMKWCADVCIFSVQGRWSSENQTTCMWIDVLVCFLMRTFSAGCVPLVSQAMGRLTVMSSSGLDSGAWTPSTQPLIFIFCTTISSATSWTL